MALPIDTVPGSVLSGFGFALEEHGCLFEQLPVWPPAPSVRVATQYVN
jgi:hypothetical protein